MRPESVSNAMKVLEVHEDMLERGEMAGEDLGDGEKALVREMCNVSFVLLHFLRLFLFEKTLGPPFWRASNLTLWERDIKIKLYAGGDHE